MYSLLIQFMVINSYGVGWVGGLTWICVGGGGGMEEEAYSYYYYYYYYYHIILGV